MNAGTFIVAILTKQLEYVVIEDPQNALVTRFQRDKTDQTKNTVKHLRQNIIYIIPARDPQTVCSLDSKEQGGKDLKPSVTAS